MHTAWRMVPPVYIRMQEIGNPWSLCRIWRRKKSVLQSQWTFANDVHIETPTFITDVVKLVSSWEEDSLPYWYWIAQFRQMSVIVDFWAIVIANIDIIWLVSFRPSNVRVTYESTRKSLPASDRDPSNVDFLNFKTILLRLFTFFRTWYTPQFFRTWYTPQFFRTWYTPQFTWNLHFF